MPKEKILVAKEEQWVGQARAFARLGSFSLKADQTGVGRIFISSLKLPVVHEMLSGVLYSQLLNSCKPGQLTHKGRLSVIGGEYASLGKFFR